MPILKLKFLTLLTNYYIYVEIYEKNIGKIIYFHFQALTKQGAALSFETQYEMLWVRLESREGNVLTQL